MKKEIKFNLPKVLFDKVIKLEKEIKYDIKKKKEFVSKSTAKHLVYKREEFLYFLYYTFNHTTNKIYSSNGMAIRYLQYFIPVSTHHKLTMYIDIALEYCFIEKVSSRHNSQNFHIIIDHRLDYSEYVDCILKYNSNKYGQTIHNDKIILTQDNKVIEDDTKISLNMNNDFFELYNFIKLSVNNKIKDLESQIEETSKLSLKNSLKKKILGYETSLKVLDRQIEDLSNGILNKNQHKSGRIQYTFSTMKREFRNFLLINGNETNSFDFKNSQPAFFANEYKDEIDEDFYKSAINGKIYELFIDRIGFEDELRMTERDKAKDFWMKTAYWNVKAFESIDGEEAYNGLFNQKRRDFIVYFPLTGHLLDDLSDKYSDLSDHLKQIESKHINELSKILKENGIDNVTMYDEIIFENKNTSKATEILEKYLNENNIKITYKLDKNNEEIRDDLKNLKEYEYEIILENDLDENLDSLNKNKDELDDYILYIEENIIKKDIRPYSNWFLKHSPNDKKYKELWDKNKREYCLYLYKNKVNDITEEKIREAIKKQIKSNE